MGFGLLFRGCVAAMVVAASASCTFDLEEVEAMPVPRSGGSDGGALPPDAAEASSEAASLDVANDGDVAQEVDPIDGCWPPSDAEFCASSGVQCGALQATDVCGQLRNVACGDCATEAHCEQGICVDYLYTWATGAWSSCSDNCGGGTSTRDVQCARDDGETASDTLCTGTKPAGSQTCNEHPCCVTPAAMQSDRKCTGGTSDIVAWVQFHFGLDDGSPANQAQCAAQCTAWAQGASLDQWCCDLVEDTTTGHSYSCAAHTDVATKSFSHPDSDGGFASLGSCETP